jgi:HK97 family phage prohead protease
MTERFYKTNADARIEAKSDSTTGGEVCGYAAVWDIVDADNDRIRHGAFKRSIGNQIAQKSVPLMVRHFRDGGDSMESVGVIVEGREDDFGFWVRAELDGSAASQELRKKIVSNPGIFGMSVGWTNTANGFRPFPEGGREFFEMNLKEVTVTLMPAQQATMGTLRGKSVNIEEVLLNIQGRLEALEGKATDEAPDEDAKVDTPSVDVQPLLDAAAERELLMKGLEDE